MPKGSAISVYLDDPILEELDKIVELKAAEDRARGQEGYQVTNRSKLVNEILSFYLTEQKVTQLDVQEIKETVSHIAKKYGAAKVSLFGSYARNEQTAESDIDLLLDKGNIKGLQVIDFQKEVQHALGRRVDVVTTEGVGERFIKRIDKEKVVVYEAE